MANKESIRTDLILTESSTMADLVRICDVINQYYHLDKDGGRFWDENTPEWVKQLKATATEWAKKHMLTR